MGLENTPEVRSDIDLIYSAVMLDNEALEEAKMTLEVVKKTDPGVYDEMINDTLSLIRRALSNSILGAVDRLVDPEEPVAWVVYDSENNDVVWTEAGKKLKQNTRLYTAPPQRKWQGLTDEERIQVLHSGDKEGYLEYAKGIEAKLKEKNNG